MVRSGLQGLIYHSIRHRRRAYVDGISSFDLHKKLLGHSASFVSISRLVAHSIFMVVNGLRYEG